MTLQPGPGDRSGTRPSARRAAPPSVGTDVDARVLHAAQRAALLVIRNGGATPVAERVFDSILHAHGQDAVETVWRLDFIAASRGRSGEGAYLRSVGALTVNLALVGEVEALAGRAMADRTRIDELDARLHQLETLPSPYPRSAMVAAAASAAGFLAHMLARDEGAVAVACVAPARCSS